MAGVHAGLFVFVTIVMVRSTELAKPPGTAVMKSAEVTVVEAKADLDEEAVTGLEE